VAQLTKEVQWKKNLLCEVEKWKTDFQKMEGEVEILLEKLEEKESESELSQTKKVIHLLKSRIQKQEKMINTMEKAYNILLEKCSLSSQENQSLKKQINNNKNRFFN